MRLELMSYDCSSPATQACTSAPLVPMALLLAAQAVAAQSTLEYLFHIEYHNMQLGDDHYICQLASAIHEIIKYDE